MPQPKNAMEIFTLLDKSNCRECGVKTCLVSSLNVFFDDTADKNLTIGSVYSLGAGLSQMFEKLSLRHGFPEAATYR